MVPAYSRLTTILRQKDATLGDLRTLLEVAGVRVGQRALARLADESKPVERLDLRLAAVICQVCEISLGELIVFRPAADDYRRLPLVKHKRLEYLMDGNNDGTLTTAEMEEFRRLVRECEEMTIHNARFLAERREMTPA